VTGSNMMTQVRRAQVRRHTLKSSTTWHTDVKYFQTTNLTLYPNTENAPFLLTFALVPILPLPFLLDTTHNTQIGKDFKSAFIAEL